MRSFIFSYVTHVTSLLDSIAIHSQELVASKGRGVTKMVEPLFDFACYLIYLYSIEGILKKCNLWT